MDERLKIAIQALKNIVDPIGALQKSLKEDEQLNGHAAVLLTKDPHYYIALAKDALSKIECNFRDHGCPLDECKDITNCVEFR